MLVVPADGEATLVVPGLEAPRVVRAARRVRDPAVGRDRGPGRDRRRAGRVGRRGGHRRPHLGPLPGRPPGAAARGPRFERAGEVVGPLRAVKDAAEVAALRRAAAAADRVAAQLQAGDIPLVGRTEAEVSADIGPAPGRRGPRTGSTSPSSPPAPTRPARTTTPGDRVIEAGEVVLCDFGGTMPDDRRRGLLLRHHPLRPHRASPPPSWPSCTRCCTRPRRPRSWPRRPSGRPCEEVDAVGPRRHRRGRPRRPLHPPHRARHRRRGARGPLHRRRQRHRAGARPRLLDRARDLPARAAWVPASRTSWSPPTPAPIPSTRRPRPRRPLTRFWGPFRPFWGTPFERTQNARGVGSAGRGPPLASPE